MVDSTKPKKTLAPVYNNNKQEEEKKERILVSGSDFITENTGFIKDFYKISSCIGRGMLHFLLISFFPKHQGVIQLLFCRRVR